MLMCISDLIFSFSTQVALRFWPGTEDAEGPRAGETPDKRTWEPYAVWVLVSAC